MFFDKKYKFANFILYYKTQSKNWCKLPNF